MSVPRLYGADYTPEQDPPSGPTYCDDFEYSGGVMPQELVKLLLWRLRWLLIYQWQSTENDILLNAPAPATLPILLVTPKNNNNVREGIGILTVSVRYSLQNNKMAANALPCLLEITGLTGWSRLQNQSYLISAVLVLLKFVIIT